MAYLFLVHEVLYCFDDAQEDFPGTTRKKIELKFRKFGELLRKMTTTKNTMNTDAMMTKIMEELAAIRAIVADNKVTAPTKERKPRKPRDPDAPPNPWIVFTGKVRTALKTAGKPAGKECQQFASFLKTEFPDDAYNMDDSEILAAHADWTPPPPKPKEDGDAKPAAADDAKPKPKRTLSDEQKAKMAAGRKAAAERRKAETAASHIERDADNDEPETATTGPSHPVTAPALVTKTGPALRPLPFKGKKYLWDAEGNGLWLEKDGIRTWAGKLSADRKSIDASATDYTV